MPSPQALAISLSQRQQSLLEQMVRRTTNAYRLVRRAQLVLLAAQGADNTEIGQRLQLRTYAGTLYVVALGLPYQISKKNN
jgi:hypothetical protein